ncbi:MAG: lipid-A-disaccharide synthase [Candidatus Omnitrophica bacterium]|nr:lipid-A-disaccharide synthase [Candidatus Omnitrophota bacterium]
MEKNILIIAGEASGDVRGGELLSELGPLLEKARFWGFGGDNMSACGVEIIEHVRDLSMVGLVEVLRKLPSVHAHYRKITTQVLERKPDLAILIDYPGFNLKTAKFLHRQGIPVIYYIIPQVWAWGAWRLGAIKEHVSKALVLFDFEQKLLEDNGIDAVFVGHPLVDEAPREGSGESKGKTVALLPGSRENEVHSMLPVMLDAAEKINSSCDDTRFILAESANIPESTYSEMTSVHGSLDLERVRNDTFGCLARSDFAIVTSGTATLETAIMEKPMIITYKASVITELFYKILRRVPFLGLVNIIAGRQVVPELLQAEATAGNLSAKTLEILSDNTRMESIRKDLAEVKRHLGEKGASRRAAEEIKRFIDENIS